MTPAIALLVIGGMLLYSGWHKNTSIADVFAGTPGATPSDGSPVAPTIVSPATGNPIPAYGQPGSPLAGPPSSGKWTAPAGGASDFRGPRRALLNSLAGIAQNTYGLKITATTNGVHVPGSYHYSGRAFDCAGSETKMADFTKYCLTLAPQLLELIHDPTGAVKNGQAGKWCNSICGSMGKS